MPLPDVVSGLLLRVSCEFDSRRGCQKIKAARRSIWCAALFFYSLLLPLFDKLNGYKNLSPFPKSQILAAVRTFLLRYKNLSPFPKSQILTAVRTFLLRYKNLSPFPKSQILTAVRTFLLRNNKPLLRVSCGFDSRRGCQMHSWKAW